ncbi:unnamed protein product [Oikopleura dioica]|uniref:Uncharacterized protein n=1 Tax=Oikopleura dioica TaxID=34765 RepID=E4XCB5_OIKDI|nr:unnamed protein product [Oikopleura dioica]CBY38042.1 unnamed protein product [Oikopleura dioica]
MDPLELADRKKHISIDLNVPLNGKDKLSERLRTMKELGWSGAAISVYVPSGKEIPKPPVIKENFGLRLFTRVTVEVVTNTDKYNVRSGKSSTNLNDYDIICVIPGSEKIFQDCCKDVDCDLISFDLAEKLPYDVRRGAVSSALRRNVQFEFNYSSWLMDSQKRKNGIQLAFRLGEMSRHAGVVLSSESYNTSDIRAPSDASYLMALARFPENCLNSLVERNPTNCAVNAFKRKTRKCAVLLKRKTDPESHISEDCKKQKAS